MGLWVSKAVSNLSVAAAKTLDYPRDLTGKTTAQTGFYTHRGLDEQASSIRPGALTLDTPPRSRPQEHGWTRGSAWEDEKVFIERLESTYSPPGSGFDAYLRFFREVSA
jgi:hypothetical protein